MSFNQPVMISIPPANTKKHKHTHKRHSLSFLSTTSSNPTTLSTGRKAIASAAQAPFPPYIIIVVAPSSSSSQLSVSASQQLQP
jgi:hypothetical protein